MRLALIGDLGYYFVLEKYASSETSSLNKCLLYIRMNILLQDYKLAGLQREEHL